MGSVTYYATRLAFGFNKLRLIPMCEGPKEGTP
jgi:hypothetical protein